MTKMNPVVHFELPSEDSKRMSDFYTTVFGWKTNQMGPEMGNYVTVQTTETDENRMVKTPGTINGGFFPKSASTAQCPTVVISVDDIQASMKAVVAAGGKIMGGQHPGQPDDIPGVGLYIAFEDTEGNRIAMLQPKRK